MLSCCTTRAKDPNQRELQSANQLSKSMMIEKYIFQTCQEEEPKPVNMITNTHISKSDWLRIIHTKTIKEVSSQLILHNLQNGIPAELRPAIWIWMSGAELLRMKHGNDLYQKLKGTPSQQDSIIFKEVQLALKGSSMLDREDLFDLLRAYSNYDNEVKINKEVIAIVRMLFETFDRSKYTDVKLSFARNEYEISPDMREVTTFWVFIYIMNSLMLREGTLFPNSYKGILHRFTKRSEIVMSQHVPSIINHLKLLGLTPAQCFGNSILSLLQQQCPKDLFMSIFDAYLWHGEAVTNTIFVNLLKQSEEIILLFQTTNDITTYLNETLIPYGLEQLKHGGRTAIFKRQ